MSRTYPLANARGIISCVNQANRVSACWTKCCPAAMLCFFKGIERLLWMECRFIGNMQPREWYCIWSCQIGMWVCIINHKLTYSCFLFCCVKIRYDCQSPEGVRVSNLDPNSLLTRHHHSTKENLLIPWMQKIVFLKAKKIDAQESYTWLAKDNSFLHLEFDSFRPTQISTFWTLLSKQRQQRKLKRHKCWKTNKKGTPRNFGTALHKIGQKYA